MNEDLIANLILAVIVILMLPASLYYAKWILSLETEDDLSDVTPSSERREWQIEPAIYRNNPK